MCVRLDIIKKEVIKMFRNSDIFGKCDGIDKSDLKPIVVPVYNTSTVVHNNKIFTLGTFSSVE